MVITGMVIIGTPFPPFSLSWINHLAEVSCHVVQTFKHLSYGEAHVTRGWGLQPEAWCVSPPGILQPGQACMWLLLTAWRQPHETPQVRNIEYSWPIETWWDLKCLLLKPLHFGELSYVAMGHRLKVRRVSEKLDSEWKGQVTWTHPVITSKCKASRVASPI